MKLTKLMASSALVTGLAFFSAAALAEESVEVLHWWTSGGEAAALNVLKQNLEGEGVTWLDNRRLLLTSEASSTSRGTLYLLECGQE